MGSCCGNSDTITHTTGVASQMKLFDFFFFWFGIGTATFARDWQFEQNIEKENLF